VKSRPRPKRPPSEPTENLFEVEALRRHLGRFPVEADRGRAVIRLLSRGGSDEEAGEALDREIRDLRATDVEYWAPIIEELRRLRTRGRLLEGRSARGRAPALRHGPRAADEECGG
jgi:hypothetical protein